MSAIRDQVAELVQLLEAADLTVYGEVPEAATAPFVYVLEDEPWIEPGTTFGNFRLRVQLVCVAEAGTNTYQADQLADLVTTVITALVISKGPFTLAAAGVSQPGEMTQNGQSCLGCSVSTIAHITRTQLKAGGA